MRLIMVVNRGKRRSNGLPGFFLRDYGQLGPLVDLAHSMISLLAIAARLAAGEGFAEHSNVATAKA